MTSKTYSKFTLEPKDKEQKQRFIQFRNEDVHQMFIYQCVLSLFGFIISLIAFLVSPSRVTFTTLLMQTLINSLNWSFLALGKRLKDKMVYLIMAEYLLTHLIIVVTTEMIHISNGEEASHKEQTPARVFVSFAIHCLLLAPSFWSLALVYMPYYILTILFFRIRCADDSHEAFVWNAQLFTIPVLVTFWYVYQRRELKRFFQ